MVRQRKKSGKAFGYCGFQHFDETSDVEIVFAFLKDFGETDSPRKRQMLA